MPTRLNLFGITGAATESYIQLFARYRSASISLESRVLRPIALLLLILLVNRLNLFGITGAATGWTGWLWEDLDAASISLESRVLRQEAVAKVVEEHKPPQSLWNHGCCDYVHRPEARAIESRLNLFGITGAATSPPRNRTRCLAASISLESRVLRPPGSFFAPSGKARLNLFGITGAATSARRLGCG